MHQPGALTRTLIFGMAHVVTPLDQPSNYKDSQARLDRQRQNEMLAKSTTLYVNLALSNSAGYF
jgi:hypothetical protein